MTPATPELQARLDALLERVDGQLAGVGADGGS
jgi:hypothetical protein